MNPRSEWKVRKLRALVAARDNWLCYRCIQAGKPLADCRINPSLRWPNPMSVSLEHTHPLTTGGQPYNPATCTVSHLRCNQSHGATLGNQQRRKPQRTELTW